MNSYTTIYDSSHNDGAMIFAKGNQNIKKYINEEPKDIQHLLSPTKTSSFKLIPYPIIQCTKTTTMKSHNCSLCIVGYT